jgi:hypothetical protein
VSPIPLDPPGWMGPRGAVVNASYYTSYYTSYCTADGFSLGADHGTPLVEAASRGALGPQPRAS